MGFLNGFLRTLGFEGDKKKTPPKENDQQKQKMQSTQAQYDLKNLKEKPVLYEPKSQSEVQTLVDKFKNGEDILVDLKNMEPKERTRALDFFSGATYALSGKIKQSDTATYFFCHLELE